MKMRGAQIALAAASLLLGRAVLAHEFECEKQVNGVSVYEIDSYPATLNWTLEVKNIHPTEASTVLDLEDALLEALGFVFEPEAPYTLQLNDSETYTFQHTVADAAACARLSNGDGTQDDNIDNTFIVRWDSGEDQCMARVVCLDETPPPPPPPPPAGAATRTMGFFKTHLVPLQACLDEGAIDLGPSFDEIDTVAEALGLLWESPSRYGDDTRRSELDKHRFLLARQTLVAICNQRLFNTPTDPVDLIADALAALEGTDCELINQLANAVDQYNNSGTDEDFPEGFVKGPATPKTAAALATDPSIKTTDECTAE